jgi:hypothetical protein
LETFEATTAVSRPRSRPFLKLRNGRYHGIARLGVLGSLGYRTSQYLKVRVVPGLRHAGTHNTRCPPESPLKASVKPLIGHPGTRPIITVEIYLCRHPNEYIDRVSSIGVTLQLKRYRQAVRNGVLLDNDTLVVFDNEDVSHFVVTRQPRRSHSTPQWKANPHTIDSFM